MNVGRRTILLVEDEPLIAMMLEDFLVELGCDVAATADTVGSALEMIESHRIDAVILDVNLRGGEKSWPVADALAARSIPFIMASGDDGAGTVEAHRARPLLQKPFTIDEVEQALDRL